MNNQTNLKFSKVVNSILSTTYPNIKVYAIIAKDNIDKFSKFITFKRDSIQTITSKDRLSHLSTARYTINFFARNYADGIDLAQQFIETFDNQHINDNEYGYSVIVNDVMEDYDETFDLFVQSLNVEFSYAKIGE